VVIFTACVVSEAPLEIILELCRDLRRDVNGEHSVNVEEGEVDVRMESAKILVISHDISLRMMMMMMTLWKSLFTIIMVANNKQK